MSLLMCWRHSRQHINKNYTIWGGGAAPKPAHWVATLHPPALRWSTPKAQAPDRQQRLQHDPARHLRLADAPIGENDRHLADRAAGLHHPIEHLDLKRVAVRMDRAKVDRFERAPAIAAKAAGGVHHRQTEDSARIDIAATADHLPDQRPVDRAAVAHIARAKRKIV